MAMSGNRTAAWVAICLSLCVAAQTIVAQNYRKTYKVGDSIGWTYMNATSGQPADYQAWADHHTFFVNDVLEFVYEPKESNVYAFENLAALNACNISGARLLDNGTSGTSEWFLPKEGFYNFGSSLHCTDGQKFRIFVNVSTVPYVPDMPMPMSPGEAPSPDHEHMAPTKAATAPASGASAPKTWTQTLVLVVAGTITLML